jgi:hypothetical protein
MSGLTRGKEVAVVAFWCDPVVSLYTLLFLEGATVFRPELRVRVEVQALQAGLRFFGSPSLPARKGVGLSPLRGGLRIGAILGSAIALGSRTEVPHPTGRSSDFASRKCGGRGGIRRILLLFATSEYPDYQSNQAIPVNSSPTTLSLQEGTVLGTPPEGIFDVISTASAVFIEALTCLPIPSRWWLATVTD